MDISAIIAAVVSDALATGLFEQVNSHEPKNAPGNGVNCAVWVDEIQPLPEASGLVATSAYLIFNVQIYMPMLQQPYDAIDPALIGAVNILLAKYSAGFTLGGQVRNVDLLGAYGSKLGARAGYIDQDKKIFRVMTITLPLVVNDVWTQAP